MRKVDEIALALVTLCVFAVSLALGQGGSAEQQISALSDQMIRAQLKADISYFEKHYADDATIVHGDGEVFTKAKEIGDLNSGSLKYDLNVVRERKVHIYGDTAVVAFLMSYEGTVSGKPFSGDLRRTVVWVKQNGNWSIVAYQVTRLGWQAVSD